MAWNWHFQPHERHWSEQTLPLYCQRRQSRSDPYFHFRLFTLGSFLRALLFLLFGWGGSGGGGWLGCQLRGLVQCLIILFLNSLNVFPREGKMTRIHLHSLRLSLAPECRIWDVESQNGPSSPPSLFHYLFRLSLLAPSLLPPAMLCSSSQREKEGARGCFDVGFDRFVCCCIHLLCIRELTGRKMKICLRFSAWLFGGKWERTPCAFQIHIFPYLLKNTACAFGSRKWMPGLVSFPGRGTVKFRFHFILLLLLRKPLIKKWQLWIESCFSGN